jgi:hypothetical protein
MIQITNLLMVPLPLKAFFKSEKSVLSNQNRLSNLCLNKPRNLLTLKVKVRNNLLSPRPKKKILKILKMIQIPMT